MSSYIQFQLFKASSKTAKKDLLSGTRFYRSILKVLLPSLITALLIIDESSSFLNQKDFCYFTIKIGKRLSSALICQRPARAFLIFTVPSQIPYKQRLPSLIFANICLTILITRVFHRFFGMFIVYSYFPTFILKVPLSSFFLFFPFLCIIFL